MLKYKNTKKMVKIEALIGERKVIKISELELERYVNFFTNSYKENIEHSKTVMRTYPRWSSLMREGYKKFISLANDLAEAKKERVRAQYYTGTAFMKEEYRKKTEEFLEKVVYPYINKINALMEEAK